MGLATFVALLPLAAVLGYVVREGIGGVDGYFLTHSMKGVGPLDDAGGAYHAIVGTLEQVAIAFVLAVPLGIATAVHLAEYGRGRLTSVTRFVIDVMAGLPSIVAGLFVFTAWVLALGQGFSGLAAGIALAILMLPTVVRTTEEVLRLVPQELREGAHALGVPKWRTIVSVVLPAARDGIVTGVLLAVARVVGETAPLLLTAFGYDAIRSSPVDGPQASLPVFVFSQASSPFHVAVQRAWAGALVLIGVVLLLNLVARVLVRPRVRG